jgi:hypothetical protein
MRRPFIAGNWKMNTNRASAVTLAEAVAKQAEAIDGADMAVCPPSCYLEAVGRAIAGSKVALGAQNMYHEKDGAFTGELSAAMLCDLGCKYVILGHSERRHVLGETDASGPEVLADLLVHDAVEAVFREKRLQGIAAAGVITAVWEDGVEQSLHHSLQLGPCAAGGCEFCVGAGWITENLRRPRGNGCPTNRSR